MKLTLVNLYPDDTVARYLLSSYVLKAYLYKVFNNRNLSVTILNSSYKTSTFEICEKINNEKPNYVGYSCYTWNIQKITEVVCSIKKEIDCKHILGGPEITLNWIDSLEGALADYYIIGAGEKILADLIDYFFKSEELSDIKVPAGVAHLHQGKVVYTSSRNFLPDLDDIPSVYLTGTLENHLYDRQQAFLETSRGCKFKCAYCMYHKNLSNISYYSLQRIFAELYHLIIEREVWQLRIFDSDFTSDIERAKKIIRYLFELKNKKDVLLPWIYWEFTIRNIDEEFIKLCASLKSQTRILNSYALPPLEKPQFYSDMVKNYTTINCIGIQSFSDKALKAVNRSPIKIDKFDSFMGQVKHNNIILKIDLILGLPCETFDSYFNGLEYIIPYFEKTDHILNIHRLQVLPGSKLEEQCSHYGVNYSTQAPHMVSSTNTFSEKEMKYASKLTAIIFRVLNSPIRKFFFEAKKCSGKRYFIIIEKIFIEISQSHQFKTSALMVDEYVDDIYWNNQIFRDIPSAFVIDIFKRQIN